MDHEHTKSGFFAPLLIRTVRWEQIVTRLSQEYPVDEEIREVLPEEDKETVTIVEKKFDSEVAW